jgi:hypothetical protein
MIKYNFVWLDEIIKFGWLSKPYKGIGVCFEQTIKGEDLVMSSLLPNSGSYPLMFQVF